MGKYGLLDLVAENVIRDYHTAKIKSEILLDTLLTPVIGALVEVLSGSERNVRLITKEFPLYKLDPDGREYLEKGGAINADYLLAGDEHVILVELKTTAGSLNDIQDRNYERMMHRFERREGAARELYSNFCRILVRGSSCGYSPENRNRYREDLSKIFEDILAWEEAADKTANASFTERALYYLDRTGKQGSAKYVFQAGQMLDARFPGECAGDPGKEKDVRLIYLVPKRAGASPDVNTQVLYLEDALARKDEIGTFLSRKERDADAQTAEYWNWLAEEVLGKLFPQETEGDGGRKGRGK